MLATRRKSFEQRRDLLMNALDAIDGLDCRPPQGTFFAYPSCAALLGKSTPEGRRIVSDRDFAAYLLESEHVGVVPGAAFGLSPHVRISFALSAALLEEACARIRRACAALG